jgi:hypothetical protein
MIYIEKDNINIDDLIVLDENDNPVSGLIKANFTIKLYNPNGDEVADDEMSISFEEIGDGVYRVGFTPDELGNWSLLIYHITYFPFGKGENYNCVDSLGGGISVEIENKSL